MTEKYKLKKCFMYCVRYSHLLNKKKCSHITNRQHYGTLNAPLDHFIKLICVCSFIYECDKSSECECYRAIECIGDMLGIFIVDYELIML